MFKFVGGYAGRTVLFIMFDREDTELFDNGGPIAVDVKRLTGQGAAGAKGIIGNVPRVVPPIDDVVLCAGETIADAYQELEAYVPWLPSFDEVSGTGALPPSESVSFRRKAPLRRRHRNHHRGCTND